MRKILFCAALALLASGCAHTSTLDWHKAEAGQVSSKGNPVLWHLTGTNRGMFLFNLIPLWSGYPTRPNRHEYKLGQNCLSRADMRRLMDKYLTELEADKVEDLKITSSSSGAFTLWIIWRRTVKAEAVAVKVVPDAKKTVEP